MPVLPLRLEGGVAWLGPYVDTSFTACVECVAAQRDAGEALEVPEPSEPDPDLAADLTAALVTAEAVALLSRVGSTHTLHGLVRTDLVGWHQRSYPVAGLPGCPNCGDGGAAEPEAPAALAYEESVAFPPRSLTNPATTRCTTGRGTSRSRSSASAGRLRAMSRCPTPRTGRAPAPSRRARGSPRAGAWT
nr:hypothetical protein GCM10020093_088430 [Planobispora longispora]